jgi:hypothetical protein
MLKEAEQHSAPKGTFRESKKPYRYDLIAKLNFVIDSEPSTFEEASNHSSVERCYDRRI